jgi:hypothetical protein
MSEIVNIFTAENSHHMQEYVQGAYRALGDAFALRLKARHEDEARAAVLDQQFFDTEMAWLNKYFPLLNRYMAEIARRELQGAAKRR